MNHPRKITKAVFPVAGLGTRFLPATKASPKEMLPIVDKPLIQYAAEEAIAAGITDLVFITGRNKRSIEDHFDKAYELEATLLANNKTHMLNSVRNFLPDNINCVYIRQSETLGLGHAVLRARSVIQENEAFAVILADELLDAQPGALSQMLEIYQETGSSVLGVYPVDPLTTASYGIISIDDKQDLQETNGYKKIEQIIEKPEPKDALSNLAVIGRYILTPAIFDELSKVNKGVGGEIQLTDAIAAMLNYEPIYAHEIVGTRYDCGSKLGYLQATIAYGIRHKEVGAAFSSYLSTTLRLMQR